VRRQGLNAFVLGNLALLLPMPSPTSDPFRGHDLPPHLLHTHQRLLLTPSSVSKATSYKTVLVTLEKGNESRCFAGTGNVSVRHRQLHRRLCFPLFSSWEQGGGRGQGRIGQREVSGVRPGSGKVPQALRSRPEGAPSLLNPSSPSTQLPPRFLG